MQLSHDQENELLKSRMGLIYRHANRFLNKYSGYTTIDLDDCIQECTIAYLNYIRRAETEEDLKIFPAKDLVNALCRFVLGNTVLSSPKRTSAFREILASMPETDSVEYLENEMAVSVGVDHETRYSEVDEKLAYEKWSEKLSDEDRKILYLRSNGMTQDEIASELAINRTSVCRRLRFLKQDYINSCGDRGYKGGMSA